MPRSRSSKNTYSSYGMLERKAMTDEVVPHFHKRRDAGELICSPANSFMERFEATRSSLGHVVGYYDTRNVLKFEQNHTVSNYSRQWRPSSTNWANGTLNSGLQSWMDLHGVDPEDDLSAEMHTAVSSKMASGIASILVTMAETRKTVAMFIKAMHYLMRPLKDVARIGKRMTPRERLETVEGWWLEGRYGWRPFVHDVMNIYKAGTAEARYRLTKKEAVPFNQFEDTLIEREIAPGHSVDYSVGCYAILKQKRTLIQALYCGQTGDFHMSLKPFARVLGAYDLVGTVVDLIPYSFVYEWFVNVGEAAKAMEAYCFFDERIGWTKRLDVFTNTLTVEVGMPGPFTYAGYVTKHHRLLNVGDPYLFHRVEQWTRDPITDFIPNLGLRCDLDWKKVVDLAALMDQLWTRVFGRTKRAKPVKPPFNFGVGTGF